MKKQAFKARIKKRNPQACGELSRTITQIAQIFLFFGMLLVGCGETAVPTPTATLPSSTPVSQLVPTPTLIVSPTAVASQTPEPTATPEPDGLSIGDPYALESRATRATT